MLRAVDEYMISYDLMSPLLVKEKASGRNEGSQDFLILHEKVTQDRQQMARKDSNRRSYEVFNKKAMFFL